MGREKKIVVRELFESANGECKCKQQGCKTILKGDHYGNLKRHLMKCHSEVFEVIRNESDLALEDATPQKKKKNCIELSQNDVVAAMLQLIATEGAPFKLLDSAGLRVFTNPICEALSMPIINSHNIDNHLSQKAS